MIKNKVVILGGGVSGLAAGYYLSQNNIPIILIEKEKTLGGVASSIKLSDGRQIPLSYHHIVSTDKPLLAILEELGLTPRISWRKISILADIDGKRINLASPFDVLFKFKRLPASSRYRYLLFGARCLLTKNWRIWEGHSVNELINKWADARVLREIFVPLTDIKFGLNPQKIDAAWLGERLSKREAATPLGYIRNASWTAELCQTLKRKIQEKGGEILLGEELKDILVDSNRIIKIKTSGNKIIEPLAVVSTLPPAVLACYLKKAQAPKFWLKPLEKIRYISSYSLVAGLSFKFPGDYWTIALHPRRIFGACFNLSTLNETLVTKKDACVINLFTNVAFCKFSWTDKEYIRLAKQELSEISGRPVSFNWAFVNRLNFSSPIFERNYNNPPICLGENLFLAGIYATYPWLSSTGSAMGNGKMVAQQVIKNLK